MAQQTAVEYIISQLRQLAFNENTHLGMGDVRVTQGLIDELEEQAKQMEKEQIAKAWDGGNYQYFCSKITNEDFDNGYEYYEENYNKTNDK